MTSYFDPNFYCSKPAVKVITENYTAEQGLRCLLAELTANTTITLPEAGSGFAFFHLTIRLITAGYTLTIQRSGSDIIYKDATGATSLTSNVQGAWVVLEHDNDSWHVVQDSGDF